MLGSRRFRDSSQRQTCFISNHIISPVHAYRCCLSSIASTIFADECNGKCPAIYPRSSCCCGSGFGYADDFQPAAIYPIWGCGGAADNAFRLNVSSTVTDDPLRYTANFRVIIIIQKSAQQKSGHAFASPYTDMTIGSGMSP